MSDVATIDRHLEFLHAEIAYLSKRSEEWAQRKAEKLQAIVNTLVIVRRDKQMAGAEPRRPSWG